MLKELTTRATLHAAFERVRENGGCRGADGVTISSFAANLDAELDHLQDRLLSRRYRPFPLLRIEIPKAEAGVRHLAAPTIRDRVLQTAVYHLTRERFEAELEDCSYAFRQGRSVKNAVHRVDELRRQGFRWIVDADLDDFFGRIPHDRLFHRVHLLGLDPYVESLFAAWVEVEIYPPPHHPPH
jgi:retron-type reverse transcriptase